MALFPILNASQVSVTVKTSGYSENIFVPPYKLLTFMLNEKNFTYRN